MGSKMVFHQIESNKPIEEIVEAATKALSPLGGQINPTVNGLQIIQGKNNIQFGFAADFDAILLINKSNSDKYTLNCTISWKMSTVTIACLIIGLFVFGILWIVPLLYLFIDPSQQYQNALMSISSYL